MRYIKFKNRTPMDNDIPGWQSWSKARWDAWLQKSMTLKAKLTLLHTQGEIEKRNALIDKNAKHWGQLKDWLRALSYGKCWFSEAKEIYSHYDVEHFRPKKQSKGFQEENDRDGYWWLAFDYTNFRLCGNVGNRKKGGWFPLQEGSIRSDYPKCRERSESYYLLDPARSSDVALLAFDESGNACPAPDATEWEQERVEISIDRLGLNDFEPLAEARRDVWQRTTSAINEYVKALYANRDGDDPGAAVDLGNALDEILHLTDPSRELSSVACWCVVLRDIPKLTAMVASA